MLRAVATDGTSLEISGPNSFRREDRYGPRLYHGTPDRKWSFAVLRGHDEIGRETIHYEFEQRGWIITEDLP
jgi:hypothetical protein